MPEHSGIFYTDNGSGVPVVLIHGFCETHEIWNEFSKSLTKDFRVLCVDLPGFGKSTLLQDNFSLTDVAEKLLDWISALKIERCHVIGHSLGGYVALAMAELNSSLLISFGLFHSTAFADSEERKISRNKVIEFVSTHGVAPFIESFIPPLFFDQKNSSIKQMVALASRTQPATLIAYTKAMRDRPDRTSVLQHFSGPILFVAGEKDGGIPSESVQKQGNLAFNGTLHILPNVAHMGMFESEEVTLLAVYNFLKKHSSEFL